MTTSFPLPDDYFGPFSYTPDQLSRWKFHMQALVEQTLRDEEPVFESLHEHVDRHSWKPVKTKGRLRVYKPRRGAASGAAVTSPCVLAVGTIEGTLEDAIYGLHTTTTRDLRATCAFLTNAAIDAAVLHVFENGTQEDPYRSLALKWRAVATPAGNLVKNRDACVLDYMGTERDTRTGKRYAFHISESVDHPICPPFVRLGVVRADVHVRSIYRELDDGRVGVYFYGEYNMSGQIPKIFASWTATTVAGSVGNSVTCAEAKKLTAIALANRGRAVPLLQRQATVSCSICRATASSRTLTGRHLALKECRVCCQSVCTRCCESKHLLTDAAKIRVVCCTQCVLAAKRLHVDPRRPLRLVSSAVWIAHAGDICEADACKEEIADARRPRRPTWPIELTSVAVVDLERSPPSNKTSSTSFNSTLSTPPGHFGKAQFPARAAVFQRAHSVPNPHAELWQRMWQLRAAAEHTARLTDHVQQLMQASTEPGWASPSPFTADLGGSDQMREQRRW